MENVTAVRSPADLPTAMRSPIRLEADGPTRIPQLDGVRGVAVLMVLVCHFSNVPAVAGRSRIDEVYYTFAGQGAYGVDLFFVLSGFLISGILLKAKGNSRHYFRSFYIRRVLRIFPLYYGFLAFMIFLLPWLAHRLHHPAAESTLEVRRVQWMYWLYISNLHEVLKIPHPDHTSMGHLWSLAVEEQFYLIWPFVVFLVSPKILKRICWLMVPVALAVRMGLAWEGRRWWLFTFSRMDSLLIGALAAIAMSESGFRKALPRRGLWSILVGCGVLALLAPPIWLREADPNHAVFKPLLLALSFAALVILAAASNPRDRIGRVLASSPLVFFGKYSYGIYVFHPLIEAVLIRAWKPRLMVGTQLIWQAEFAGLCTGAAIIIAMLSYHLYEKRFLALKHLFPY